MAQRLALSGERIDAGEAERIGLISGVVDDEALGPEAMATAQKLAQQSGSALRQTRALFHASYSNGFESQLEREAEAISSAARGVDGREGIAAFIAKRKPSFGAD